MPKANRNWEPVFSRNLTVVGGMGTTVREVDTGGSCVLEQLMRKTLPVT